MANAAVFSSTQQASPPLVDLPPAASGFDRILLVGTGSRAARIAAMLQRQGHVVVGALDDRPQHDLIAAAPDVPWLGGLDEIATVILSHGVDKVCVAMPWRSGFDAMNRAHLCAKRLGVPVVIPFDVFDGRAAARVDVGMAGPTLHCNLHPSRNGLARAGKRAIDLVTAVLALVCAAPLLVVIALAVLVTSGRPVFFMQDRVGLNRRRFRMIKFRTMVPHDDTKRPSASTMDPHGVVFKVRDDMRVTRLGRWLRRSSLDELPQLFNVIRGDMSVVGPRPLPIWVYSHVADFDFHRRFSVLPGLTGAWQVRGRVQDFNVMMRHDLAYVDDWTFLADVAILLQTPGAVLGGRGAI